MDHFALRQRVTFLVNRYEVRAGGREGPLMAFAAQTRDLGPGNRAEPGGRRAAPLRREPQLTRPRRLHHGDGTVFLTIERAWSLRDAYGYHRACLAVACDALLSR
jgi:hypothetical protein